jgi:Xaa-Pro aminopeptidase
MMEKLLAFSIGEYEERLAKVRSRMDTSEIDCLIVTHAPSICYLSGYAADTGFVPQALIIPPGAASPHLILRAQYQTAGYVMSCLPRENVHAYPESFIANAENNGFDFIVDLVQGIDPKSVGAEFGGVSWHTAEKFRRRLNAVRLVDATGIVNWVRLVKSPAEIELQRQAAAISDVAMRAAFNAFSSRTGATREYDVAARVMAALISGTPEFGGDVPHPVFMSGGDLTGSSHIFWTQRPLVDGRHYNVGLSGYRHRYAAPLMRTFCLGEPSSRLRRLHDHIDEGCENALSRLRPGALCGDVAEAFVSTIRKGGYDKSSRCGYPVGIDWLEPSLSLKMGSDDSIPENSVWHLNLGTWPEDDFGAVISETVLVTGDGNELLTSTPREILIC